MDVGIEPGLREESHLLGNACADVSVGTTPIRIRARGWARAGRVLAARVPRMNPLLVQRLKTRSPCSANRGFGTPQAAPEGLLRI
jgi:hypothetical protein